MSLQEVFPNSIYQLINILDFAEPAIEKSRPRRTLIISLSLLSGLMIGSIIILIQNTKKSRS